MDELISGVAPAEWVPYLINNDKENLSVKERRAASAFAVTLGGPIVGYEVEGGSVNYIARRRTEFIVPAEYIEATNLHSFRMLRHNLRKLAKLSFWAFVVPTVLVVIGLSYIGSRLG